MIEVGGSSVLTGYLFAIPIEFLIRAIKCLGYVHPFVNGKFDVRIGYLDPEALKARYGTSGADQSFKMMAGALDKLTGVAAAAP